MITKTNQILKLTAVLLLSLGIICGLQVTTMFAADSLKTIQTAKGGGHMLMLKEDGTVWAWGSNEFGQLGSETLADSTSAVQVGGLTGIKAVAAGRNHSLALKEDGTVFAWGSNMNGELGDNTNINKNTPVQMQGLTDIIAISAGENYSLALKSDGTVWSVGANSNGQIGDETLTKKSIPVQVHGLTDIKMIVAGNSHSLALNEDGAVFSWGNNDKGQLGSASTINRPIPENINGLANIRVIFTNGDHCVAITEDDAIWYWGYDAKTKSNKVIPTQMFNAIAEDLSNDINKRNFIRKQDIDKENNITVNLIPIVQQEAGIMATATNFGTVTGSTFGWDLYPTCVELRDPNNLKNVIFRTFAGFDGSVLKTV